MTSVFNKKISEIKKLINNIYVNDNILSQLANDPSIGVQKIYNKLIKIRDDESQEHERLKGLNLYEDGLNIPAGKNTLTARIEQLTVEIEHLLRKGCTLKNL